MPRTTRTKQHPLTLLIQPVYDELFILCIRVETLLVKLNSFELLFENFFPPILQSDLNVFFLWVFIHVLPNFEGLILEIGCAVIYVRFAQMGKRREPSYLVI